MADAPRRIQRRRSKGWKMPPNTIYVGRPTKWGNPFQVGTHGPADVCLRLYRYLAAGKICVSREPCPSLNSQRRAHEAMSNARIELRGKDLACFCPLDQPCHADILLELANAD